jgi:hypothetical protein
VTTTAALINHAFNQVDEAEQELRLHAAYDALASNVHRLGALDDLERWVAGNLPSIFKRAVLKRAAQVANLSASAPAVKLHRPLTHVLHEVNYLPKQTGDGARHRFNSSEPITLAEIERAIDRVSGDWIDAFKAQMIKDLTLEDYVPPDVINRALEVGAYTLMASGKLPRFKLGENPDPAALDGLSNAFDDLAKIEGVAEIENKIERDRKRREAEATMLKKIEAQKQETARLKAMEEERMRDLLLPQARDAFNELWPFLALKLCQGESVYAVVRHHVTTGGEVIQRLVREMVDDRWTAQKEELIAAYKRDCDTPDMSGLSEEEMW